jgi:murein DD-endopeptidase MepM/ murein hydrolase activator NlpD
MNPLDFLSPPVQATPTPEYQPPPSLGGCLPAEPLAIWWPLLSNVIRERSKSNTFGVVRTDPQGKPKPHQGWDLQADRGTDCYAVAYGKVEIIHSDAKDGPYGMWLLMSFPNVVMPALPKVLYAFYAHLDGFNDKLRVGDWVSPQTVLCQTGKTGNAAQDGIPPHLHFEIRDTGGKLGPGLNGRVDPQKVYGPPPLFAPVLRYAPR